MSLSQAAIDSQATLAVRSVSKTYRVDGRVLQVLSRLALDIAPGEFVIVVGASGCGKSTLLRLIVGLDPEYEGAILLDGRRIDGPGPERGIVFQDHRLFPWLTVADNIALGLEAADVPSSEQHQRVAQNIALVGLQGFEN